MASSHTLVRDFISDETAEAFEQIARAARNGDIIGGVFGLHLRGGRRYLVNSAGSLSRDPTLARGIIAALDDELARKVQSNVDTQTTL